MSFVQTYEFCSNLLTTKKTNIQLILLCLVMVVIGAFFLWLFSTRLHALVNGEWESMWILGISHSHHLLLMDSCQHQQHLYLKSSTCPKLPWIWIFQLSFICVLSILWQDFDIIRNLIIFWFTISINIKTYCLIYMGYSYHGWYSFIWEWFGLDSLYSNIWKRRIIYLFLCCLTFYFGKFKTIIVAQ